MQAQYKMVDDKTGRYLPFIYPEELPFWEGTKNRQLKLQRCSDCHKAWYPIGSTCPHCFSTKWEWALMSGRGVLHNFVIYHKAWTKWFGFPWGQLPPSSQMSPITWRLCEGNESERPVYYSPLRASWSTPSRPVCPPLSRPG